MTNPNTPHTNPVDPAEPTYDTADVPAVRENTGGPVEVNSPNREDINNRAEERYVDEREEKARQKEASKVKGSFAASTWAALIVGFLLLILLIIFILQNQQHVEMNFFTWTVEFPAGIAFLIFAIAGALIMALVGGWRMLELRRQVRKQAKRANRA